MINNITYYLIYGSAYAFSLLPMRVLYLFSDCLYVLVYHLLKYRVKVVRQNLHNSFPQKSETELKEIEKNYYKWFCDYIVETIKLTSISEKEMRKRMRFEGLDEVRELTRSGKNISVYMGHYCNWEWVSSFGMHLPECLCGQIYHELENKAANRFFLKIRGRFGSHSVKMDETLLTLREWMHEGKINLVGYISDQAPGYKDMHCWPTFLNQKTPTYTGTERLSRMFNNAVYYMEMSRPKRGYYIAKMVKICDEPNTLPKHALTEEYYKKLESSINENPAYWLWSHKRWKRTWDDFCREIPDEKERKRILEKV